MKQHNDFDPIAIQALFAGAALIGLLGRDIDDKSNRIEMAWSYGEMMCDEFFNRLESTDEKKKNS